MEKFDEATIDTLIERFRNHHTDGRKKYDMNLVEDRVRAALQQYIGCIQTDEVIEQILATIRTALNAAFEEMEDYH